MKKKLGMTAIILLMTLASASWGEFIVTTADGLGADGGVSNDGNQQDTVILGTYTTAPIRHYDGVRAKATVLRFDVRGIGGDLSGATLSVTTSSANRSRTMNIYHLTDDSLDNWEEATLSYSTAPGLLNPEQDGYLTMDETKWTLVGSMPFAASPATNTVEIATMADPNFINNDENGLVTLLLYTGSTDSSHSYYVYMKESGTSIPTLTFPNARFATNPVPAIGEEVLPSLSQLCWTNTEPNNPVNGVISCDVYLGTNEPNLLKPGYGLTQIASGTTGTCVTIPPAMLPLAETTYYWIVDSYDSSWEPAFLGTGAVFSFNVTSVPIITTHPQGLTKRLGESAEFSITAESYSTPTYTWYRSVDDAANTPADDVVVGSAATLTLPSVAGTDEGYYFCKVVNSSGEINAAYSNTALLVVERKTAHWTLDTADFIGGQYLDISGEGHHADPNSATPSFVDGVNPILSNQGVAMDALSFARAGTWNPAAYSGRFSVSFWMNWNGTGSGFRGLVAKHNGWDAATTLFQLGINSSNTLALIRAGGGSVYGQTVPANEWVFVTLTYDGSTARIYSHAVNSAEVSFVQGSGAFTLGNMPDSVLYFGCSYVNDLSQVVDLFPGAMDEIQVFNYALSATEIADLYNEAVVGNFCLNSYGLGNFDLDVNDNCLIDLTDFAAMAAAWMECGTYPATACP